MSETEKIEGDVSRLRQENESLRLIATEMRESLEHYSALIESTDDSIYLVDPQSRYLFKNKKHLARMGLRPDEVLGKAYCAFHSPEETDPESAETNSSS